MPILPDPWRQDAVAVASELLNMAAYSSSANPAAWSQHMRNRLAQNFDPKWAASSKRLKIPGMKGIGSMDMMASGPGRTYRDGVLGSMAMASGPGRSFQDGVLGGCAGCGLGELNQSAFRDGVLGNYLSAYRDGSLGALDMKNPLLWAGVGVAALGAFLLLKKKPMKSNRRRGMRRNRRRARRR